MHRTLVNRYTALLDRRPMLVKSLTMGSFFFAGDILAQTIEHRQQRTRHHPRTNPEQNDTTADDETPSTTRDTPPFRWDVGRTLQLAGWGLFASGPSLHLWFRFLDTKFDPRRRFVKLALDQLCFTPVNNAVFFSVMSLAKLFLHTANSDEDSPPLTAASCIRAIRQKLESQYWSTLLANWSVWPIFNYLNFRFVSPPHRVLYTSAVALLWNTYLSSAANSGSPPTSTVSLNAAGHHSQTVVVADADE